MNFVTPEIAWAPLTPILIVLGAAAAGVLVESFIKTPATRRVVQLWLSGAALLAALVAVVVQWGGLEGAAGTVVMSGKITVDLQSLAWQLMLLIFAVLSVLLFASKTSDNEESFTALGSVAPGSVEEKLARRAGLQVTEVFPLALFAVGGMMLFTCVTDLIFLFVALELFSLPLYILVALARRRRLLSQEAALKYFLLGAFSSAIFLFGAALVYGATTQIDVAFIGIAIEIVDGRDGMLLLGAVMVIVGLMFKIGAAPFHSWVPDVYQGAPTPVTAFMGAATKAAATAALIRVMYLAFYPLEWELSWMFWAVAILSMALGTVLALVQTDIKRMLAYSAVAHAGFILVAFAGLEAEALAALPFYLLTYGLATIGAFAIITQVRERAEDGGVGAEAVRLGQWAGLGKRSPLLAGAMALFLLSFAGIPLTAGFIGKFEVFSAAVAGGAWILVLIAVIASAVAAFFYVRLIVLMFFTDVPEGAEDSIAVGNEPLSRVVIYLTAIAILVLGILPSGVLELFQESAVFLVIGG
ncbi:NADH-quinone oxidoreductase subunit NuoN [Demequina sp. B12]|uniref:NADH-quinone oxidoreductase subunit NuoN n=1 Tax=Demequina sp. B12 TaxID=2992757 RepID=UPI00237C0564|nr:NADH-quinone oxidoreductase subunit NuoN [Demequina sp. B12]MDE0572373.1 NADH-quinone oxidoreductase subunit NuoN [Demequina sp. B12]